MPEQSNAIQSYGRNAYRSDAIPKQNPMEEKGRIAKAIEAGDFMERLPWGHYAGLDANVEPEDVEFYQKRTREKRSQFEGSAWTHLQKPTDMVKGRWLILIQLAGSFGDKGIFKVIMACAIFAAITAPIVKGEISYLYTGLYGCLFVYGLHLFFNYPFLWIFERNPGLIMKDLGCGYFRSTGMVKFRTWREDTFEAPFIEFDPYISFQTLPNAAVTYKLLLQHRYSGWQTTVIKVGQASKDELYAHWDQLQRYMDVTHPLPDVPDLEPYRSKDPTTAAYDAAGKRRRHADYWVKLDLEWWKREGYPAHMKQIRDFPWGSLEDKMEQSVPNLREAAMV
ncbi:MAG: hypothetical protein CL581_07025 [Alteromonadaceae bacterium]|nr:hypothetical protein [Alteromonadaceae bacterium]MBH84731.1 hypothetical protein [Alteromonadaceae bacterium]|tara:strand:- start:114295 stop:115305 length:1011 start_codon:yes stop_codon:yes gene_type:complete